jgi:hypothetical protein
MQTRKLFLFDGKKKRICCRKLHRCAGDLKGKDNEKRMQQLRGKIYRGSENRIQSMIMRLVVHKLVRFHIRMTVHSDEE